MKLFSFKILPICVFFIMLLNPESVFQGASLGILLWFQTVLPTLLPFVLISGLLIQTNALFYLSCFFGPALSKIFGTSPHAAFPIIAGFLCGYPMGAKTTADLVKMNYLSTREGCYLLSFCNNTSPAFLMNFVILQNLGLQEFVIPSILLVSGSCILCSFLFRPFYRDRSDKKNEGISSMQTLKPLSRKWNFSIVDNCIMDSFETVTKVGGYIMIFSIILQFFARLFPDSVLWTLGVLPSLELTNGVVLLAQSSLALPVKLSSLLALSAFGGFCAIAQTSCMLNGTKIPIFPYIIEKLVTAAVTSLMTYLYCMFLL